VGPRPYEKPPKKLGDVSVGHRWQLRELLWIPVGERALRDHYPHLLISTLGNSLALRHLSISPSVGHYP
jgi:hypothetical protein